MKNALQIGLITLFMIGQRGIAQAEKSSNKVDTQFEEPIVRVVDLDIGEKQNVQLANGKKVAVKLLKLNETRDPIRNAVRNAVVDLEIDGKPISLQAGMYNLPQTIGPVQIDCSATSGLNSNGTAAFWGLDKAARIRLWPANSPLIKPGSFLYPVKQRWFATSTWFDNEPVDGGTKILPKIYYHSGLDIGATEHLTEVVAATDALVVSAGEEIIDGYLNGSYAKGSPVAKRYDVVYLRDKRGWFYRYSHLAKINEQLKPGRQITKGTQIGFVGKEGSSGGWSHLHFEIKCRQPSGKWGTQAGYAFLHEAYRNEYKPKILASARPGHFIRAGNSVTLDGSRSWSASGAIKTYEWQLADGSIKTGSTVSHRYPQAGVYHEILKVTDQASHTDYDFCFVKVIDPRKPDRYPPNLHAVYHPTMGIQAGQEITFKVRGFGYGKADNGPEIWDFGDGTDNVKVHSVDGRIEQHAKDGYALTKHRYEKPGHYLVTVQRKSAAGLPATFHLQVRVGE